MILFLAANPRDTGRLALDQEMRAIHLELKRSGYRDRFDFMTRWAAEPLDLLRELRELKPTVVHFSGHGARPAGTPDREQGRDIVPAVPSGGEPGGVVFDSANGRSQLVTPEAIARTFGAVGPQVRLVVLNACYTAPIAEALRAHVDCVVGMSGTLHDDAARSFAIGFYGGLGESESIAAAFEQAKAAIHLDELADADRPQLQVRDGFDPAELILAAVPPSGLVAVPCPYPGMRPFAADDAGSFHGREAEIAELIGRLRAGQREIFVIGPSGSGKSSLVAAGVLPRLARGLSGLGPLVVRELRPGDQPFSRLCQALDAPPGQPLAAAVPALLAHRAPGASALIVVDQLEELFTQASAEERAAFLDALRALRTEARCSVIYTLRADFSGALMESPLWPERPAQLPRVDVIPLRGKALREAITAPAEDVGVTVEPELIERLVADAASEPGILPLLQEALVQLWDTRVDQTLTLADYQALGDGVRSGLAVALARRADATLQRFNAAQTDIARRTLLRLISFGEGRSDTRRQQPLAQLRAAGDDASDFELVLRTMVDHRLLTVDEDVDGEPRVDLAHEIMISAWPTLATWTWSHRTDEQQRRQLEAAAALWVEHGRDTRGLLDPIEIVEAEAWQQTESALQLGRSAEVSALITASRMAQGRRRRRERIAATTGRLIAILAVVAAFAAIFARDRANEEHRLAEKDRELVTQVYADWGQEALLDGRFTEALIYLDQAARRGDDSPKLKFMRARAAEPLRHERGQLPSTRGRTWWATFSPDGRWIVTTDDGGAQLWDARSLTLRFSLPHGDIVYQAAFTPDETQVVTVSTDGMLRIWNMNTGELVWSLHHPSSNGDELQYFALSISPDGTQAAAIDIPGTTVQIWDLRSGELIKELIAAGPARGLPSLEFSHDGRWLATSAGGDISVYETATWQRTLMISGSEVSSLAFDPSGPRLAVATLRGDVSIWTIPGGARAWHLRESGDRIRHVAYSPDGAFVVAPGGDGVDRIWNAHTGELQLELKNHHSAAQWAEFDASSRRIVSTDADGEIVISDVLLRRTLSTLEGPRAPVRVARFDPSSRMVIGASWDGTARVWDATSSYLDWATAPIGSDCGSDVRAESDRRFIAVACGHHGTLILDTGDAKQVLVLARLPGRASTPNESASPEPAVNATGDRAAIASGNTVTIYALPGQRIVGTIRHPGAVTSVSFAASGRDLLTGSADGSLLVTPDGQEPRLLVHLPAAVDVARFLPGSRVVVADKRPRLGVYDTARREWLFEIDPGAQITAFRLSSSGTRLVTIPTTGAVHPVVLWDLERGQRIVQLEVHKGSVFSARFVRGDEEVLTAGADGAARLWDAATGRLRKTFLRSSPYLVDAALDPSGTMVVTAGGDGVLRFWDASSARMIWALQAHASPIAGVQFQGDEDLVTRGFTGEVAHWRLPRSSPWGEARLCLPLRFDDETGGLVEQDQPCRD